MTYLLLSLIAIAILFGITLAIFRKLYKKYKLAYENEHTQLVNLQQEYSTLVEAYKIKKENKEKADEKISDLHSGTVSADDILPKRKSRK